VYTRSLLNVSTVERENPTETGQLSAEFQSLACIDAPRKANKCLPASDLDARKLPAPTSVGC